MKADDILEKIKEELAKLSPHLDYNFSIESKWKKGTYTAMQFDISEEQDGTI